MTSSLVLNSSEGLRPQNDGSVKREVDMKEEREKVAIEVTYPHLWLLRQRC